MAATLSTDGGMIRPANRLEVLERLREQVGTVLRSRSPGGAVTTGWDAIDGLLPEGGLSRGAVHEWIGTFDAADECTPCWRPPLSLLLHFVRQAHFETASAGHVIWIGPAIWPYPIALCEAECGENPSRLLTRSIFVRTVGRAECVAATELALRSRTRATVVIDASQFNMTQTRRLQLAAESGVALCLLARPPGDQRQLSAAHTRWLVHAAPSPGRTQRWSVQLLRCKGVQSACSETPRLWILERDHATRNVALVADVVDRPRAAQSPPIERVG